MPCTTLGTTGRTSTSHVLHVNRRPNQPQIDDARTQELEVEGHDLPSLLFAYLDEFLFRFSTEAFVAKRATILELTRPASSPEAKAGGGQGEGGAEPQGGQPQSETAAGGGDTAYRVRVRAEGEGFDLAKYVHMYAVPLCRWVLRVHSIRSKNHTRYNITMHRFLSFLRRLHTRRHPQGTEIKAITYSNMQIHEKEGRADVYVIVDI